MNKRQFSCDSLFSKRKSWLEISYAQVIYIWYEAWLKILQTGTVHVKERVTVSMHKWYKMTFQAVLGYIDLHYIIYLFHK